MASRRAPATSRAAAARTDAEDADTLGIDHRGHFRVAQGEVQRQADLFGPVRRLGGGEERIHAVHVVAGMGRGDHDEAVAGQLRRQLMQGKAGTGDVVGQYDQRMLSFKGRPAARRRKVPVPIVHLKR